MGRGLEEGGRAVSCGAAARHAPSARRVRGSGGGLAPAATAPLGAEEASARGARPAPRPPTRPARDASRAAARPRARGGVRARPFAVGLAGRRGRVARPLRVSVARGPEPVPVAPHGAPAGVAVSLCPWSRAEGPPHAAGSRGPVLGFCCRAGRGVSGAQLSLCMGPKLCSF